MNGACMHAQALDTCRHSSTCTITCTKTGTHEITCNYKLTRCIMSRQEHHRVQAGNHVNACNLFSLEWDRKPPSHQRRKATGRGQNRKTPRPTGAPCRPRAKEEQRGGGKKTNQATGPGPANPAPPGAPGTEPRSFIIRGSTDTVHLK